jgi:hypothetical protein
MISACSFSAARFSRKQQERQRRASGAKDSGHGERALEFVGERGGKRSAAVEPDPVVGNPADQPDMREAEPWHHALLGEQNGRDDERSSDTRLASVVSRWLGRNVGAWDPA